MTGPTLGKFGTRLRTEHGRTPLSEIQAKVLEAIDGQGDTAAYEVHVLMASDRYVEWVMEDMVAEGVIERTGERRCLNAQWWAVYRRAS